MRTNMYNQNSENLIKTWQMKKELWSDDILQFLQDFLCLKELGNSVSDSET